MSGYLGSIGFALPAALGAWAAVRAQRPIVAVAGDGGFGQYMADLTTSVKYGMNIKLILINNGELGKISKEQRAGEFEVWQTSLHNPNFSHYAQSCGALGIRVEKKEDLEEAMKTLFRLQRDRSFGGDGRCEFDLTIASDTPSVSPGDRNTRIAGRYTGLPAPGYSARSGNNR